MKKLLLIVFSFFSIVIYGQTPTITIGQQYGKDALGNTVAQPIGGIAASTTVALAANATWSTPVIYYNGNNNILLVIQTNVAGTYAVEYYMRNGTRVSFMGATTAFIPNSLQAAIAGKSDGVKITYINGPVAQDSLYIEVGLYNNNIQPTLRTVGNPMSNTNLGLITKGTIEGKDSVTAPLYRQVTTTSIGSKVGFDVKINDTVNARITNGSVNATIQGTPQVIANIDSTKTRLLQNVNVVSSVPVAVTGTFYQSTQPVSLASIPLATGASSSALQTTGNNSLGATSDAFVTDPTQSASIIALLKGLLQETLAPATTGSFQAVNLAANVQQTVTGNSSAKGRLIFSTNGTILIAFGFTATATNYSVRIVTNGFYEVPPLLSLLPISLFSTAAAAVNITTTQ